MTWFNYIWLALGLGLLGISTLDVLWSTLGMGGGPILRRYGTVGWALGLWIHTRFRGGHRVLGAYGVVLLVAALGIWTVLHWFGWTFVVFSQPEMLMTPDGVQASFWERLYFVGSTMATLGRGDLVVGAVWWKLLMIVMSLHSIFVLTLVISFLVPVAQAATKKRALARRLHLVGRTPEDVVKAAVRDGGFDDFDHFLRGLITELTLLQEQHVTYPLLHFLHSPHESKAFALRLVILDEALTILLYGIPDRAGPDDDLCGMIRDVVEDFLDTLGQVHVRDFEHAPPGPHLDALREHGIETRTDAEWNAGIERLAERRKRLRSLVYSDGWEWKQVTGREEDMPEDEPPE